MRSTFSKKVQVVLLIFVILAVFYPQKSIALTPGVLEIHTIDVGQGDATLIVSPEGKTMLIDVNSGYASKVSNYIQSVLGVKTIDYLLATHYHADHIGGIVDTLSNYGVTVSTVLDRGGDINEYDSATYRSYYTYITDPAHNINRIRVYEGDLINLGPSITVKVVSVGNLETDTASGVAVKDENDNSIALKLTYNQFDYFVAGDLSGANTSSYADIETAVAPKVGEIEVYRVDHHGSSYSSNQYFVDTLKPTVSIISVGSNTYGHPSPTVVDRLKTYGTIYQTEDSSGNVIDGDIVLTTSGGSTYVIEGITYNVKSSTPDTTPPVISAVQTTNITTNSATITWTTDEAADGIVYYGLTTSYGSQASHADYLTSHSINLTGLNPNTLYHYKIVSKDQAGNVSESIDYTFTTLQEIEMFVKNIDMSLVKTGKSYTAQAVVTIYDVNGNAVSSATVYATWSGLYSASVSGITDSNGNVTFTTPKIKGTGTFTITVNNVAKTGFVYNSSKNVETSDSIIAK